MLGCDKCILSSSRKNICCGIRDNAARSSPHVGSWIRRLPCTSPLPILSNKGYMFDVLQGCRLPGLRLSDLGQHIPTLRAFLTAAAESMGVIQGDPARHKSVEEIGK